MGCVGSTHDRKGKYHEENNQKEEGRKERGNTMKDNEGRTNEEKNVYEAPTTTTQSHVYEVPTQTKENEIPDLSDDADDDPDGTYLEPKYQRKATLCKTVRVDAFQAVAAIDFGTTRCGLAFGLRSEILNDPTKVYLVTALDGTMAVAKSPTTVLFDENKSFIRFGYEAEKYFSENPDEADLSKMFLFRNFKMALHNNPALSRDTLLDDITGTKSLPAIDVFSAVIQHFSNLLFEKLDYICENKVFWVLTVPAIWNLKAKQFMAEAAEKAGISMSQFALALEPEVASLTSREISSNSRSVLKIGMKYVVVDVGGGTVDITGHRILEDGGLEELYHANGGPWGGDCVNKKFEDFMYEIFGEKMLNCLKTQEPGAWLDFLSEFEKKKCYYANREMQDNSKVRLKLPVHFKDILYSTTGMTVDQKLGASSKSELISMSHDKLFISTELFSSFFDESIMGITSSTEEILKSEKLTDCEIIIMVGGYAQSRILQEAMRIQFASQRLIVPEDPQYAVLKGAVMFGFRPRSISSRVCRYTYGVAKQERFDPTIHPENKKQVIGGRAYCDDVFDIHVRKGDVMEMDVFEPEKEYMPTRKDQTLACLELYASTERDPKFITDPSCQFLGIMEIELTLTEGRFKDLILVRLNLSGTNIEIEAQEKNSGKRTRAICNFLG